MPSTDLFKQAIAEAKTVREAAIANAKIALEETLTPHLKSMLAAKLQEMDKDEETEKETLTETEEEIEENSNSGFKPVKAKRPKEIKEAEDDTEESEDDAENEPENDGMPPEEAPEEEGEPEEELPTEEEDDIEIGELTVGEFKSLIRGIIAQEMGNTGEEPGMEPGEDLDAGDVEGMGEEPSLEEPGMQSPEGEEEEEIDLDELLRELEGAAKDEKEAKPEPPVDENKKKLIAKTKELNEAVKTVGILRKELQEVNLLNSKLLYVNKIFKANNLTESQKVNVITTFDKAESVKEVKLVFDTVSKGLGKPSSKTAPLHENRGSASRATGLTVKPPEIIEVDETVKRWQKLAGIEIKK
jgi:hypothetical protein